MRRDNPTKAERRDAHLRRLRRRVFVKVRASGADALVAFSPNGSEPPAAFQEMSEMTGYQRLYPADSGYLLKWPYQGQAYDPNLFRIELGGWDHEHCSVCDATIEVDEVCWITKRGSFYVLCRPCHRRLTRLGRA